MPDDIEMPTDLFLEPPELNVESDEDSGEEDEGNPDRFSKRQLQAGVEIRFGRSTTEDEIINETTESVPQSTHTRVQQNWEPGNEENFPLSAKMFKSNLWEGSKIYPLTMSAQSNAIDFFELFFPKTFIDSVILHTTNYALKKKNKSINIVADDIYAFLGTIILSGYNVLPRRRMYWENDEDVGNILISKWIRRKTFEDIFTNIHFCDIDQILSTNDRFAKIRPFIDHLNDVFLKYAPAEMDVSIDESMIPYYGRHPCKQFIRNKPIRFGYKAWVAASRLGYCYQFDVYQGRNQQRDPNLGLGESVVLGFAQKMQKRFPEIMFSFYFDNFFTGPNLISALNNINSAGTGTVRENRLKNIRMKHKKVLNKKPRGFYENYVDTGNEIILTRWKDNQVVSLLSNHFGEHPVGVARRYVHAVGKKMDISRPNVVKMYNRNMGGVDLMDRHISNYRICIRGKKLYMPVVLWMLDVAVTNAWSLAKSYNINLDQLKFRRQLATALLTRYGKLSSVGNKTPKSSKFLAKGVHTCVKGVARLRCKYCHSQTIYKCSTCNIALHTKCSKDFHSQLI